MGSVVREHLQRDGSTPPGPYLLTPPHPLGTGLRPYGSWRDRATPGAMSAHPSLADSLRKEGQFL